MTNKAYLASQISELNNKQNLPEKETFELVELVDLYTALDDETDHLNFDSLPGLISKVNSDSTLFYASFLLREMEILKIDDTEKWSFRNELSARYGYSDFSTFKRKIGKYEANQNTQKEHVEVDDHEDAKPLTPDELNHLLVEPVDFPIWVFPEKFQNLINEISCYFQTDKGIVGTIALTMLSGTIGNTCNYTFKEDYSVKPFLWSIIVEPSGFGKTPIVTELKKPIDKKQSQAYAKYLEEKEVYETEFKIWNKDKSEEVKKPAEPALEHFYTKDFTMEVLVNLFISSPKGLIVDRDEIAGLIKSFNQYKSGKGSDRENFLSLFNCGPMKVDRKGTKGKGEHLLCDYSGAAIIGTIQPRVLPKIFENDTFDDGLTPRFLFVVNNNDTLPPCNLEKISNDVKEYWKNLLNRFLNLPFNKDNIQEFKLNYEAKKSHKCFINNMNRLYPALSEKAKGFIPKLHLYCLKFAGLLKTICNIEAGTKESIITIKDEYKAQKLTEYYLSQAVQVCKLYATDESKKLDAADKLLIEILANEFKATNEDKVLLNDISSKYFSRIKPGDTLKDKSRDKFNKSVAAKIRSYGFEVKKATDNKTFIFRHEIKFSELL